MSLAQIQNGEGGGERERERKEIGSCFPWSCKWLHEFRFFLFLLVCDETWFLPDVCVFVYRIMYGIKRTVTPWHMCEKRCFWQYSCNKKISIYYKCVGLCSWNKGLIVTMGAEPVPETEGLLDWRRSGCLPACGGLPAPAYLDSRPPCGLVACPDPPKGAIGSWKRFDSALIWHICENDVSSNIHATRYFYLLQNVSDSAPETKRC